MIEVEASVYVLGLFAIFDVGRPQPYRLVNPTIGRSGSRTR